MKPEPDYRWGTPEGSRDCDRLLDMSLSFREKLEWLEQAEELSLRFSIQRSRAYIGERIEHTPGLK